MENDEKEHGRRRRQHLRVPVFPEEKDEIEANAKRAGVSVARYLRDVGQGYQIKGVMDYQHVRELVRGTAWGRLRKRKIKHAKPVAAVVAA